MTTIDKTTQKHYQKLIDNDIHTFNKLAEDLKSLKQLVDQVKDPAKSRIYDAIQEITTEISKWTKTTINSIDEFYGTGSEDNNIKK